MKNKHKVHKVLFTGDRNWKTEYVVAAYREIAALIEEHGVDHLLLIEGGAPGVDSIVKLCAHRKNVHVAEVEALWDKRGRSAGPQRNKVMIWLEPDEVIGIHSNITKSKGTKDMIEIAKDNGIPYKVVKK